MRYEHFRLKEKMGYFGQTHVGNDPKAKTNMLLIVEMYCGLITVRDGKVGCPACSPLKNGSGWPSKKVDCKISARPAPLWVGELARHQQKNAQKNREWVVEVAG